MVELRIDAADNTSGWKNQKEGTSLEPSTLGFSHYKTACLDNDLNKINTFSRDTPLMLEFSPTAWQTVANMQILKWSLEFYVDTMRCIQLMDTEYNMANKRLGKRVLAHTKQAGAVLPDQYDSRKNHKAINTCLKKQHCGVIAMNDAQGCYNRTVHSVAIMVLMSFGVSAMATRALFETLQKADPISKLAIDNQEKSTVMKQNLYKE